MDIYFRSSWSIWSDHDLCVQMKNVERKNKSMDCKSYFYLEKKTSDWLTYVSLESWSTYFYHSKMAWKLTCFAIPKSASLTRPLGSTRMFAPLMSLQIVKSSHKSKSQNTWHLLICATQKIESQTEMIPVDCILSMQIC
jgi:hypothetical protein